MCNKSLTLETIVEKSSPECSCGGGCSDTTVNAAPMKPFAMAKETTMEVVDTVKQTAEKTISKAKVQAKNETFQKGALAVIAIGALYVIFK